MKITSKQRAYLMKLASNIDTIFNVGKSSLSPEMVEGITQALDKRELVKIGVLKNCLDDPNEIAQVIAERSRSNVVKVIGKKIILYKPSKEKPKIVLPK